jgi:hypothetical protein
VLPFPHDLPLLYGGGATYAWFPARPAQPEGPHHDLLPVPALIGHCVMQETRMNAATGNRYECRLVSGKAVSKRFAVVVATMEGSVALRAQGNQILWRVVSETSSRFDVVDLQSVRCSTQLAAPPVSFEYLITKQLVIGGREFQPRHSLPKLAHGVPRLHSTYNNSVLRATFPSWRPQENRRRSFQDNTHVICPFPALGQPSPGLSQRRSTDSCKP